MASRGGNRFLSLFYSLTIHVGLAAMLVMGMDWSSEKPIEQPKVDIIQAQFVDETKVQAELKRRDDVIRKKAEAEKKRKLDAKRKVEAEKKRKLDAKRKAVAKKKADAKRKADAKKKADAKRKAELKKKADAKRKVEVEKKRKLEAKKKAEAEVKRKEAEAEKQRKAAEVEKQRIAEQERQRIEKAAREEREREMREALEAEQREAEAARQVAAARAAQKAITSYKIRIAQRVQSYWLKPGGWRAGLQCSVRVQMIPGGEVVSVQIERSCGSAIFDRSVENAVRKASPLPVPSDPAIFDRMRVITFIFKPEE